MASRLTLLGTSDLRTDDDLRVQSVLKQPRRFLLLAYLALASRKGPVQRDTVIGVFWPDSPQDKARGSLSQAVHYLRRSLGADAVLSGAGEGVEVNRARLSCDAVEFLEAYEAGRWQEAAQLYAGDLLPGFFANGAPATVDQWLDIERDRLRNFATEAAWRLAEEAEAAGDHHTAVVWARQACEWSAGAESAIRRLMTQLDRLGDRAGVVETYNTLVHSLGSVGIEPAPESKALLSEIQAAWAAEDANQQAERVADPPQTTPSPRAMNANGRFTGGRRRALIAGMASLALMAALLVGLVLGVSARDPGSESMWAGATVRIEEFNKFSEDVPVGALTTEIVSRLQETDGLIVIPPSFDALGSGEPSEAFVLRGGVLRIGDRLRVIAHLVDVRTGRAIGDIRHEEPVDDVTSTVDKLAGEVARHVRRKIGQTLVEQTVIHADAPPLAIRHVLLGRRDRFRGHARLNAGAPEIALVTFQKADSLFSVAAELAPRWVAPVLERAETAYSLSVLQFTQNLLNIELPRQIAANGLDQVERALALDPTNLDALELRALLLDWIATLPLRGAQDEVILGLRQAEADVRRVTSQDPSRARAWNILSGLLHRRGEFAAAYWALERAITADTYLQYDMEIMARLYYAAFEAGDSLAVRRWCDALLARASTAYPTISCELELLTLQARPDTNAIAPILLRAQQTRWWDREWPRIAAIRAVIYARAGARDRALAIIDSTAAAGYNDPVFLSSEAWARLAVGDTSGAQRLIERYVSEYPLSQGRLSQSRRYAGVELPGARGR